MGGKRTLPSARRPNLGVYTRRTNTASIVGDWLLVRRIALVRSAHTWANDRRLTSRRLSQLLEGYGARAASGRVATRCFSVSVTATTRLIAVGVLRGLNA
jgi:hypothetical protein